MKEGIRIERGRCVVTIFPVPEHRAEVIAAFEAAITRVPDDEPGVELQAHDPWDRDRG
jgi:hypothetical protein